MAVHELKLSTEPFEAITSGKKTIESRLYDEKRQLINLGDTIVFANRDIPSQNFEVRIIGLLRYETFKDMFTNNNPNRFGGEGVDWLLDQISEFYSEDEQRQYGVVGIQFEPV